MASHSSKVTIGHSKIQWEVGWRTVEPCHDFSFVVFLELPHGWFRSVTNIPVNFDRYGREVAYWTPTTLVCGFCLIGNHVSYTLSNPYSLWNGYWSLNFSATEHLYPHIWSYSRVEKWRRIIKAHILDQLLADWFTKSLLPPMGYGRCRYWRSGY